MEKYFYSLASGEGLCTDSGASMEPAGVVDQCSSDTSGSFNAHLEPEPEPEHPYHPIHCEEFLENLKVRYILPMESKENQY